MLQGLSKFILFVFFFLGSVDAEALSSEAEAVKTTLSEKFSTSGQIRKFYEKRSFKPVWFVEERPSVALENAVNTLKKSREEGLEPEDYDTGIKAAEDEGMPWSEREIQLSKSVADYLKDLTQGHMSADEGKKWHNYGGVLDKRASPSEILQTQLLSDPTGAWLLTYTVDDHIYQKFKEELAYQRILERQEEWPQEKITKILRKGTKDREVILLRKLLKLHGVIGEDLPIEATPDTYDTYIVAAVGTFQEKMGIKSDGFVGERTRQILNMSPSERINKLKISMERWRWLPEDLGDQYVMVNIPWFELLMVKNDEIMDRMRIIVGRDGRETPVFSTQIRGIRYNPSWTVPRSIATRDKLKILKKDPHILENRHYRLYSASGEPLAMDQINWGQVTRATFNYRLKQLPGDHNALGRVRLLMHNPYSVYLHGTDAGSQKLFSYDERDHSSGCIRVEDPVRLATFLHDDPGKWSQPIVEEVIEVNKTRNVKLEKRVQAHIVYFTAWPINGVVQFRPDIYEMDKRLMKALRG